VPAVVVRGGYVVVPPWPTGVSWRVLGLSAASHGAERIGYLQSWWTGLRHALPSGHLVRLAVATVRGVRTVGVVAVGAAPLGHVLASNGLDLLPQVLSTAIPKAERTFTHTPVPRR
jgi:hypothetical protein